MQPVSLETVAAVTGGDLFICGAEPRPVTGVVRDSREVRPGDLFLCIPGERVDGHDFAPAAWGAGAACCLAQRPLVSPAGPYILVPDVLRAVQKLAAWYRGQLRIPIVGIVGSVGKTTAKEMTAAVLGARWNVLKTPANLNNELGVPLTLLSIGPEHEAAVVEMGISDFGEMDRLGAMVRPDLCLFTVVGHAHLEFLGDLDGVLRAKAEVFRHMPPDGAAILNGDDEKLAACSPGVPRILCGLNERNDLRAEKLRVIGTDMIRFEIAGRGLRFDAGIHAYGVHNVTAALLAAAAGLRLGMTPEEIVRGLDAYRPMSGRSMVEKVGELTVINDCYNANPDSTAAALHALAALPSPRMAFLGDMKELGPREAELHYETGALSAKLGIEKAVLCGPLAEHMARGRRETAPGADTKWYATLNELLASDLPLKGRWSVLVKASHSMGFERIVQALESGDAD